MNSFVQLIRSRHIPYLNKKAKERTTSLPQSVIHGPKQHTADFQLTQLEEDIITNFFAGKPHLHSSSELRTVFKFKSSPEDIAAIPVSYTHLTLPTIYSV